MDTCSPYTRLLVPVLNREQLVCVLFMLGLIDGILFAVQTHTVLKVDSQVNREGFARETRLGSQGTSSVHFDVNLALEERTG